MLSRRTLIFIDGEIIFRCRKTSWYEEVDMYDFKNDFLSPPYFGSRSDMQDHSSIMGMNYPAFSTVLLAKAASTLSARQLTVPSDVLNAFRGVSNVLSRDINTTMFWGLPTAYFEHSLLWNITASSLNRREGFPSWSWTGWHGRLAWKSIEDSGFLMDGTFGTDMYQTETWIRWYRREGEYCRPVYLASERPDPAMDEWVKQPGLLHGRLRNAVESSLSPDYIPPEEMLNLHLQRFNLGRKSSGSSYCTFGPLVPPSILGESKRRTSPVRRPGQAKMERAAHLYLGYPRLSPPQTGQ